DLRRAPDLNDGEQHEGSEGAFQVGPPPERELESRSIIAKGIRGHGKAGNADSMRKARPARATVKSPSRVMRRRLVVRLEETRGALTAAHAHRDDAVARLAPEHLVGERADHARARHAERVADRDRAAVDVELLGIDPQAIAAVDDLRGERLVELPHVDVVDLEAVALE